MTTNLWLMESKREAGAMFRFVEHVSEMFLYQACPLQWLIIFYTLEIVFLLFVMYKSNKAHFPTTDNPTTLNEVITVIFLIQNLRHTAPPNKHSVKMFKCQLLQALFRHFFLQRLLFRHWNSYLLGEFMSGLYADWWIRVMPCFSKSYRIWVRQ